MLNFKNIVKGLKIKGNYKKLQSSIKSI